MREVSRKAKLSAAIGLNLAMNFGSLSDLAAISSTTHCEDARGVLTPTHQRYCSLLGDFTLTPDDRSGGQWSRFDSLILWFQCHRREFMDNFQNCRAHCLSSFIAIDMNKILGAVVHGGNMTMSTVNFLHIKSGQTICVGNQWVGANFHVSPLSKLWMFLKERTKWIWFFCHPSVEVTWTTKRCLIRGTKTAACWLVVTVSRSI